MDCKTMVLDWLREHGAAKNARAKAIATDLQQPQANGKSGRCLTLDLEFVAKAIFQMA